MSPEERAAHHPFGPSRLGRLAVCPGSHALSAGCADHGGKGANRGIALHDAVANRGSASFGALSSYDLRLVDACLTWANEAAARIGMLELERHVECRMDLRRADGSLVTFGTADLVILVGRREGEDPVGAIVADWKFHPTGEIPPLLTDWQLRAYALMVFQRWPTVRGVVATAYAPAGPQEQEVRIKRVDAPEHAHEILTVIAEVKDPMAIIHPQVEACRYCPAASRCDALANASASLPALAADLSRVVSVRDDRYEILDPEKFGNLIESAKNAKEHAAKFLDFAKDVLSHCEHPLYELRPGAERRKVVGHQDALKRLSIDERAALENRATSKWSIGDLEAVLREVRGMSTKEAKKEAEKILEGNLTISVTAPSIRRRKVVSDAQ